MSHRCKAFSEWRAISGSATPLQRDAFNAGWDAAMERAVELLADQHGIAIDAATSLVKEKASKAEIISKEI